MVALVGVLGRQPPEGRWPAVVRLQLQWGTTSGQIEELSRKKPQHSASPETNSGRRALLKAPPEFRTQLEKWWTA